MPFAVEFDPPGQPVILYLAGWEVARGRGGRGPERWVGEAPREKDRGGGDKREGEGPERTTIKQTRQHTSKRGVMEQNHGTQQCRWAEERRDRGKCKKEAQRKQEGLVGLEVGKSAKGQKGGHSESPTGGRLIALSPPAPSLPCAGSS